jgi:glucosamine-6-phosphate deaminase
MKVIITKDAKTMSKEGAKIFAGIMKKKPNCILGLATGGTPVSMYKELIKMYQAGKLNFHNTRSFNLDEYLGIDGAHDQSYRYFMNENLFLHVNIQIWNTMVPQGIAEDYKAACKGYEDAIKGAGGIDVQLLGIGGNGHIAFNEPGSSKTSRTRVVSLTKKTILDNARFFDKVSDVPTKAVSMGNGTILEAKKIVLLANGEGKAEAIADAVEGPMSSKCPASFLQAHKDCVIIVDKAAAGKLKKNYK